jgi:hypothetical protein
MVFANGDPEGFKDSFWEATVIESSGGAKCTVEFDTVRTQCHTLHHF